jgi:alpha-glucosidase
MRQDPMFWQTSGANPGRDGCRVPLPWSGSAPPFGFSPEGSAAPWLPQPADWSQYTVDAQDADPTSMLALYRDALRLHRSEPALGDGPLHWLAADPDVVAFHRGHGFVCVVNLSAQPVSLPAYQELILASGPLDGDRLPSDTAAWLRVA